MKRLVHEEIFRQWQWGFVTRVYLTHCRIMDWTWKRLVIFFEKIVLEILQLTFKDFYSNRSPLKIYWIKASLFKNQSKKCNSISLGTSFFQLSKVFLLITSFLGNCAWIVPYCTFYNFLFFVFFLSHLNKNSKTENHYSIYKQQPYDVP